MKNLLFVLFQEILVPYVLEGLITTLDQESNINLAPMGLIPTLNAAGEIERLTLRPFPESQTYRNLLDHPEGVFHLTDRVLLLAQAIVKSLDLSNLELIPAKMIRGYQLASACQAYEFRITKIDDSSLRKVMQAEVISTNQFRLFYGFNRGCHAVIEAAILASRVHMQDPASILREFEELRIIVEKTGTSETLQAFELLTDYVQSFLDNVKESQS